MKEPLDCIVAEELQLEKEVERSYKAEVEEVSPLQNTLAPHFPLHCMHKIISYIIFSVLPHTIYLFSDGSLLPTSTLIPAAGDAPSQGLEEAWQVPKGHPTPTRGWWVWWSGSERRGPPGCDR